MQERYLGDTHDFSKFIFLKFLSNQFRKKIGLNWYLVDTNNLGDKEKKLNDGENRNYLFKKKICNLDKKLIDEILEFNPKKNRNLVNFTKKTHLKKFVNFYNKTLNRENRQEWFEESLLFFKTSEIIFLDPDNGLKPKSVRENSKMSIKYVLNNELKQINESGKSVIFCQFQSFSSSHKKMLKDKIQTLKNDTGLNVNCPIIRNRTAPNTFFISIAIEKHKIRLCNAIKKYSKKNKIIELVNF
tara:strand:- start:180 stop:908 length:729 start_codon:yes stop_codon:yes gene_type:complete